MNIEELIQENTFLKERVNELEEKLKKYTNSEGHKRYYEKNKQKVIEDSANYLKNLKENNPDKIKEYAKRAYLKKKEKIKKEKENSNI
jgi:hypothetical protein